MVNKNRLAAMAVGTLLFAGALAVGQPGSMLGQSGEPTPTGTATTTPTRTPTPEETPAVTGTDTATETPTASPAGTPTATPRERATATPFEPPDSSSSTAIDRATVVAAIEARIADYQDDPETKEDEALVTDSSMAAALGAIASSHSDAMAAERRVDHAIDGVTTDDRYERSRKTSGCYLTDDGNNNVLPSRAYEGLYATHVDGRDEEQLGTDIADALVADDHARRALTLDDAQVMGVGLNVTDGRAYVTVAVC
jgi:hypothetical protein